MTNLIQGSDAIVSFYKEDWVPFLCATDIAITLTANPIGTRTKGDGHFKKNTYQSLEWSVTLSGLLKFDDVNWVGWDMLDNQLGFSNILIRASFTDDDDNTRSIQGSCIVVSSGLSIAVGALVKTDFSLTGDGVLMLFDGLIPCPSAIYALNITGQTATDNIIRVTYLYTGSVAKVKYRLDGMGDYSIQVADTEIDIPGTSIGTHTIEVVPICPNSYEGTGITSSFTRTGSLTCTLAVNSISVSPSGSTANVSIAFNAAPGAGSYFTYTIDGGAPITYNNPLLTYITFGIPNQTIGAHTIIVTPVCANGVPGTGLSQNYNITTGGAMVSTFTWSASNDSSSGSLQIYKNGVLIVSANGPTPQSGSFTSLSTDVIKSIVATNYSTQIKRGELQITNTTLVTAIDDQIYTDTNDSVQFIFSPLSGYNYSISGVTRPGG